VASDTGLSPYKTCPSVSETHHCFHGLHSTIELGLCVTTNPWFPRLPPGGSTFAVAIERRLCVTSDITPHVQYSASVEHRVDIMAARRKT
jgi:hypothetical protein